MPWRQPEFVNSLKAFKQLRRLVFRMPNCEGQDRFDALSADLKSSSWARTLLQVFVVDHEPGYFALLWLVWSLASKPMRSNLSYSHTVHSLIRHDTCIHIILWSASFCILHGAFGWYTTRETTQFLSESTASCQILTCVSRCPTVLS